MFILNLFQKILDVLKFDIFATQINLKQSF
jgi:hypothetical protein